MSEVIVGGMACVQSRSPHPGSPREPGKMMVPRATSKSMAPCLRVRPEGKSQD
jgi:hypothetical protein